ncbi:precorrin-6y C5,15-methyltransferase (decarboxylating) subunit CbiE [Heliophilum fasciatum]|uniref:Precorrin-6Y C5,15-methyltransferase (Decarboxylating) n=1 Tax=Heliophilum fasciatum TaxID=35700 RepID=A0A4V2SWS2_9FIRM|nr:precorrin-6y C5,15-methyltransferase (decarboxylating) subunit CbiE [Heliophilum fasciatum]MCW2278531.1 precorrin-6Y C5,15-methyltransferase (decarboxylating) [Heliophilum fasciatum]TCP63486.1 precorrin-6Y C5,15-methyltransferase (decarboxylating) [Heliophilum fasciatum]
MESASAQPGSTNYNGHRVTVIGIGPGTPEHLTPQARKAAQEADLLIGGPRALALFADLGKPTLIIDRHLEDLMQVIARERQAKRLAVLVSGDPGFYSLLPMLREKIGAEHLQVIPGLSSLQMAFAALALPWQEVRWLSMHGRCQKLTDDTFSAPGWVAFLTDPQHRPEQIAQECVELGQGWRRGYILCSLGYADQTTDAGTVAQLAERPVGAYRPAVLIVQGGEAPPSPAKGETDSAVTPPGGTGWPDDLFLRSPKIPMTKSDIRALTLARAQIGPRDTVWDIGAGTGSISIEAAGLAAQGTVWAVERLPEACDLIRQNAVRFGRHNLHLCPGAAPDVLATLPSPDVVIVGGSGGQLEAILAEAWRRLPAAGRLVVNAVTVETISTTTAWLSAQGIDFFASQVTTQTMVAAGAYHLWKSQNPITLFWAVKPA